MIGIDGPLLLWSRSSILVLESTSRCPIPALPLLTLQAERRAHFVKTYGKEAGFPGSLSLALDGAPSLVDNPRQLNLERLRKEQQKQPHAGTVESRGISGVVQQGVGMRAQGPASVRPLQIESRGKSGKRRIQPMLLSNGGTAATAAASASSGAQPGLKSYPSQTTGTAAGGGVLSDGFEPEELEGSLPSPRKRPRTGGTMVGSNTVGVRAREAAVIRMKASGTVPLVSPPELMPRRGASGSLVRKISAGERAGGNAFRPPPRLREPVSSRSGEGEVGAPDVGGDDLGATGEGEVIECTALDEDFRGLPTRRYTIVTVTRGGKEAWRDYVAGAVSACCGNGRVAAVGLEDGSIHVYDRYVLVL